MKIIEEIHNWTNDKRLLNRISYDNMAKVIKYTGTGLKKALINNTLSPKQLAAIILEFDFETDFEKKFGKDSLLKLDKNEITDVSTIALYNVDDDFLDDLAMKVVKYEEGLMERKMFSNIIDRIVSKKILLLSRDENQLMDFLKN